MVRAMELRRRRGDAGNGPRCGNVEVSVAGTIRGNDRVSLSLKRPTADCFDNGGFTPSSSEAADAVVGAAVRGGSLLIVLALIQRASTFVLNVLLHRAMLSADSDGDDGLRGKAGKRATSALEEYGAAAITLELISSTALFLAREPFRVALARSRAPAETEGGGGNGEGAGERRWREEKQQQQQQRQRFVNTAWLSVPVGLAFAGVVQLAYPWVIRNDSFYGVEENRQAASLVCLAAALEMMCEPLALIFQYRLLVDVRVRAESAAVLVLGVSRYLLVTRAGTGVLSFGYAQLLHSATLATVYILFAARDIAREAPAPRAEGMSDALESSKGLERHMLSGAPRSSLLLSSSVVTPAAATAAPPTTPLTAATTPTPPSAANDRGGFSSVWGWLPSQPSRRSNGDTAEGWVIYGHLRLARALAGQSLLKHVLTEGDKIVLARATGAAEGGSSSLHEQGVYAIASGYGSLAARLLFQPVEEAARLMFSKLGAEGMGADAVETTVEAQLAAGEMGDAPGQDTGRGQDTNVNNGKYLDRDSDKDIGRSDKYVGDGGADVGRAARTRMAALLATLLKLVLIAGLVFVCFGFHYTETLLRLLLASKRGGGGGGEGGGAIAVTEVSRVAEVSQLTEVSQVLSWYCVYVLFLAANGMCEAFSSAVARGSQLTGMGAGLVASFAVFWALVGPLTSRFGTRGLVMANASGMACRVVCSAAFIRCFFLPQTPTVATLRHRRHQRDPSSDCEPQVTTTAAATSAAVPHEDGRAAEKNLWRQVVSGALPHPCVAAAMAASSVIAHAASPSGNGDDVGGADWNATARHVALGAVCFAATALVFARYEGVFLRDMKALWAARRQRAAGGDEGAVEVTRAAGGLGIASSEAVGGRDKTD